MRMQMTRLPMGAKCGKVTCCGLWVQRSNPGCYSLVEQSSGVGSRGARLPPINGWQVRDKRLIAYTLLFYFLIYECRCKVFTCRVYAFLSSERIIYRNCLNSLIQDSRA